MSNDHATTQPCLGGELMAGSLCTLRSDETFIAKIRTSLLERLALELRDQEQRSEDVQDVD